MEVKQISFEENHSNSSGQKFTYLIRRHRLPAEANYWLYTIPVQHNDWGFRPFGVYVTKDAVPTEELADHLVKTHGVEAVKERLEHASRGGFPLTVPMYFDGWWIL